MLWRIELDEPSGALPLQIGASQSEAVVPAVADAELETALLPNDQPRWVKDAVAVSARARDVITQLRPAAVHVLSFWDHRIRAIVVAGTRVQVDVSGCYSIGL